MDVSNLLNQLLGAAGGQQTNGMGAGQEAGAPGGGGVSGFLSGRGGAALAGGAMGLLLGSKKGRKMGGKALKYGGVAALGMMAYKAYGNWQANGSQGAAQSPAHTPARTPAQTPALPQTVDRVTGPALEQHSTAVLKAIIAAAKSDGHVDDRERQLIEEGLRGMTSDPQLIQWVDRELQKPLDPVEVAAAASNVEIASEMYLASVLVIDDQSFMERSYLDALGRELQLPPELLAELNTQAAAAQANA
ncbi:MAG TPA: DUF533 domain-containing protein [Haliea salexigens]|uniref:DUF533 domain-containing protein n=1 Tax=Haliea salexigens TaxID=287487 RepID=A0A3C1KLU5_9GAMM|nr:hypothetical protein [Haliea sp.]HAN27433.1 DUF533 domain-containing protein [Haliea salexigens]|tara:strand:- start:13343 stop:14083 length:741 start_codon:yes stop_codon:yes gene_type:complete